MKTNKYLTFSQRQQLQKSLHQNLSVSYAKRIQIMLLADEGKSQTEICRILGSTNATVRHWMQLARCGMVHQWQHNPVGRPKKVSQAYMKRLEELVNHSPRDYGYAFKRWTANWLRKHLAKEFEVEISGHHIGRLLKQMGLSIKDTNNKKRAIKPAIPAYGFPHQIQNPKPKIVLS